MELEKTPKQDPGSSDPFGGNRMFRLAIFGLGILAVVGVLIFLLLILGFCNPNRQATANPTAKPPATAVVVVVTEPAATAVSAQPTTAAPTATLVVSAPTENAPTATVQNEQATAVLPTATNAPATAAAQPTKASAPVVRKTSTVVSGANQGLAGLYIAGLRYDPSRPQPKDPVTFYATIVNRTGKDQNYPLCAEVYLPDKPKPIGTTDCNMLTLVPGSAEVPVGFWIPTGIKQCIQFRARVVMREAGGEERIPVTPANGNELWTDFSVCP